MVMFTCNYSNVVFLLLTVTSVLMVLTIIYIKYITICVGKTSENKNRWTVFLLLFSKFNLAWPVTVRVHIFNSGHISYLSLYCRCMSHVCYWFEKVIYSCIPNIRLLFFLKTEHQIHCQEQHTCTHWPMQGHDQCIKLIEPPWVLCMLFKCILPVS